MKSRPEYFFYDCDEVVIIASGPSVTQEQVDIVKQWREAKEGRIVVVVNRSYEVAPWADFLFTIDGKFARVWEEQIVEGFSGTMIVHEDASYIPEWAKTVKATMTGNSGSGAIEVVSLWGVNTIWLVGCDGRADDTGRKHHHEDYPKMPEGEHPKDWCMNCPNIHEFRNYFDRGIRIAQGRGAEVWNCSPISKATKAEKRPIEDLLHDN